MASAAASLLGFNPAAGAMPRAPGPPLQTRARGPGSATPPAWPGATHWRTLEPQSHGKPPAQSRTLRSQQRPEPIPGAPSASAAKRMSFVNALHLAGPEASTPRLGAAPWGLTLSRQLQAALLGSGLCLQYEMASSFLSTLRKYLPCLSSALFVSLMPFYP